MATGEMCSNRVMFKQFMQANAMQFCQIDSCRLGGVNEILAVYLMAAKLNGIVLNISIYIFYNNVYNFLHTVKVCPHAGGVGLCEMVQHLQMWDFVSLSGTSNGRYIEYVDQQHDQFVYPAVVNTDACYVAPSKAGYNTELHIEALSEFAYPHGSYWARKL